MKDVVLVAIIAAIPGTIAALRSWRNGRDAKERDELTKGDIRAIHLEINSRMTEFLETARGLARSQGREEERGEQRDRDTVSDTRNRQDASDQRDRDELKESRREDHYGKA